MSAALTTAVTAPVASPQTLDEFLAQQRDIDLLRFITCGSVDDGKSTLIGRLLHDTRQVFDDQLSAVANDSRRWGTTGEVPDLALLVFVGRQQLLLGGFPLLGSYAGVSRAAERDVAQLSTDPGFDTRAALALYRDLAELPDGRLIDDRRCPVHVFWGSADTVLQGFDVTAGLDDALTARDVSTSIVDGADHVTTLLDTDAIIRAVAAGAR